MKQCGGFGRQDAGRDLDLVIEARVGEDFEAGADGAAFGVVGAIDQAGNASLNDRAGAHTARLDGHIERCISEAIVAEEAGGFAEDDDFRVGGGVAVANGAVAGAREEFAVMDEHGADGNFAAGGCSAGFGESFLHELEVRFHVWRRITRSNKRRGINAETTECTEHNENRAEKQLDASALRKRGREVGIEEN